MTIQLLAILKTNKASSIHSNLNHEAVVRLNKIEDYFTTKIKKKIINQ